MRLVSLLLPLVLLACGRGTPREGIEITFSGSALGAEGALLQRQLDRFMETHPGIRVRLQRTPDDASQRHQLYVQWLNARAGDPDVLQLDVVWTPEFAAAGWVLPLGRYDPTPGDFLPAAAQANSWQGELYALPWFVDVGMLYWRSDLLERAPASLDELAAAAREARGGSGPAYGIVWQGARYEGLVTVFLEYLGGFGGEIMTEDAHVAVDSPEAIRALTFLVDQIRTRLAPPEVLTWHEEETRFAFQNGNAVFMRNWPYAYPLLADSGKSAVAGRFGVAPMPAAPGGTPTAALGGGGLAINRHSEAPEAAYQLIAFLTAPDQMLERAAAGGYYPARPALFEDPRLRGALGIPVEQARTIVERARARPAIPIYSQLSELLQIQLHRALTGQATPAAALRTAAGQMNQLIERTRVRELIAREGPR